MIVTVIGYRDLKFTDRESGRDISGRQVFFTYPDYRTIGLLPDRLFIPSGSPHSSTNFVIGADYDFCFNRRGHLESIEKV